MESFLRLETSQQTLWCVSTMFCFCHFLNMALLSGVKHTRHILSLYLKCKRKPSGQFSQQSYLAHSLPIFQELKLFRLSDIFKLKLLTFVFKSTNKLTPVCFHNFSLNSSMHHYETRQSVRGEFYLARKNTVQYGVKCIQYMGATLLWDNLPVELKNSTSKFLFKKKIKVYLLNFM